MIQEKYEVIVSKIVHHTSLPRVEVEQKIKNKLQELQDLISPEGAAHIIANELNVNLFTSYGGALKVASAAVGMNAVALTVRVLAVYDVRKYTAKGREGRVASFLVGDESGTTRLVIWDENMIDTVKEVKEGSILKVKNGYVKQNMMGYKEVHLGNKAQIVINPENETVGAVKKQGAARKAIKDVQAGDIVEVHGTIVQCFEPKYYDACPACNKKVLPQNEGMVCQTHGAVTPIATPILNLFFDDGTGVLRVVLFRDLAKKVMNGKELFDLLKTELLGKQLLISGRVTTNEMFDRLEMVVSAVDDADPKKLIAEFESQA